MGRSASAESVPVHPGSPTATESVSTPKLTSITAEDAAKNAHRGSSVQAAFAASTVLKDRQLAAGHASIQSQTSPTVVTATLDARGGTTAPLGSVLVPQA